MAGIRLAVTGARTVVADKVLNNLSRIEGLERVLVLDVQPPLYMDALTEYIQVDLTEPGVEQEIAFHLRDHGINVMLHAAFLWSSPRDLEWAHELESVGTDRLLAAILDSSVKRLVVTSSISVYGITHRNATPLTEDMPLAAEKTLPPWKDKVAVEDRLADFAARHQDVVVTVLRQAFVLDRSVDRFVSRLLSRRFVPVLMGFDPLMQFIHLDDLLEAFLICLTSDHPGVFNIVPRDAIPLSKVLQVGDRIPLYLPHFPAIPAYRLLYNAGLGDIHPSLLNLLRFSLVADGSKAKNELGFMPRMSSYETVATFYGKYHE